MSTNVLRIRAATIEDAPALRGLIAQLGYDLTPAELAHRLGGVLSAADHLMLAAEAGGTVLGLLHAYIRPALDKPPEVVVQAIVVAGGQRGTGIGGRLMTAAEEWAAQRGFASVSLYSAVARDAAHAFYRGRGYDLAATSHLFRRRLG